MNNFKLDQNITIENDHVLLRSLEESDVENLTVFSLNEPELWKFAPQPADGIENLKKYIATTLEAKKNKKEFPFIVFDKKQQKYAGSTRFYDIQLENKTLQLGYTWYGKDFQGTGLNKHCKYLLLQFAFENLGVERVQFKADNTNEKSIAAMKSIGCTVEGVLRSELLRRDGTRRDSIVLSILKNEWEGSVKQMLKTKIEQ